MNLVQGASEIVEADSFNDALSLKCSWPVFEARDHLSAAAQNPGTCVYYTEMWEAVLLDPKQASTSHDCYGDFSGMRYEGSARSKRRPIHETSVAGPFPRPARVLKDAKSPRAILGQGAFGVCPAGGKAALPITRFGGLSLLIADVFRLYAQGHRRHALLCVDSHQRV